MALSAIICTSSILNQLMTNRKRRWASADFGRLRLDRRHAQVSRTKELEFSVCSMSVNSTGYRMRSASMIMGVKRLASEDAWEVAGNGMHEGEE